MITFRVVYFIFLTEAKLYSNWKLQNKTQTQTKPLVCLQGHYRFCEALYCLGEVQLALQANCSAKSLCKADPEGIKDLDQQRQKIISEFSYTRGIITYCEKRPFLSNDDQHFRILSNQEKGGRSMLIQRAKSYSCLLTEVLAVHELEP